MYIRKTRDEWTIEGNYGYGYEAVSAYDKYVEARADLKLYRENERGVPFRLKMRRVKIGS